MYKNVYILIWYKFYNIKICIKMYNNYHIKLCIKMYNNYHIKIYWCSIINNIQNYFIIFVYFYAWNNVFVMIELTYKLNSY